MRLIRGPVAWLACLWLALPTPSRAEDHPDLPPTHSVTPQLYATGFALADGPALNPAGDLFVANYRTMGTIGRITRDGTAGVFCDLRKPEPLEGKEPTASGLKIDGEGRLIVADAGAGRVLRVSADGSSVEVLADRCEGNRFNTIDDVALDSLGNIYFSDPGDSSVKNPTGSIYRYDIQTTKVTQLATALAYPTGVAVTPDARHLCAAESQRYRVLIFDLEPDGKPANRRVLIDFPTETRDEIIGGATPPQGMAFDAAGRLYVAMDTGGVINVVEVPSGKLIRQYAAGGDRATNCHFHQQQLYVTVAAKEAVFRLNLGVDGHDPPVPH
jgi:sugar lactone lactonase YvrE